jgi:hypothetical protein
MGWSFLKWPIPQDMPLIALFSVDCPFLDLVTLDGCYVGKEEYYKVNRASVDGGWSIGIHMC